MAGRKRKPGKRWDNGRLQREGIMDVMHAALERRCRTMGWRPTQENLQRARDNRLATLPGRMAVAKLISMKAAEGIQRYHDIRVRYLQAIESPSQDFAEISCMGDASARGSIAPVFDEMAHQESVRRASENYMMAEGALVATGHKSAVWWALRQEDGYPPNEVSSGYVDALEAAGVRLAERLLL